MSFIFGGGGGSVPSTTVNQQPQAGTGQFYQPQNQPQADTSYLGLLNNLTNAYASGGTPTQQIFPQALQQGQFAANITGAGGPLAATTDQITGNPYYGQAVQSAVNAADLVSGISPGLLAILNNSTNAEGSQSSIAQTIASQAPFDASLAQGTAGLGANIPGYAGATAALAPYLSGLSSQVAGGLAPTQGLAGTVSGTLPQYQALADQSSGLFPQSQSLTGGIAGNIPGIQGLSAQIAALMNPVTGLAGNVAPNAQAINNLAAQPTGASALQGAGSNLYGFGTGLAAQPTGAPQLMQGASSVLQNAFDPQSALYNRTSQQLRDQQNAINSAAGVGTSPYGAGVTGQTLGNFNIDWQNNLLNRQTQGLGAAGTGFGQAQGLNQGQLGLASAGLQGLNTGLQGAQALNTGQGNLYASGAGLQGLESGILNQAAGIGGQGISGLNTAAGVGGQALSGLQTGGALQQQIANILSGQGSQAATAGGLYGQAGGIGGQAGNLATGAGNLYQGATGQLATGGEINTAATNQLAQGGALQGLASNIFGQLPGTAAANTQGAAGLAALQAGAGGLPASTFGAQQQNNFNAQNALAQAAGASTSPLTNAANIGQAQYQLPQTLISDLANYLKLGQNASLSGASLGAIGTQNATNALSGIGSALSGAGIGGTLLGTGGLNSALGIDPATGLLGGLIGNTGSTVQDFSSGLGDTVTSAAPGSGLLGFVSSLFG